MQAGKPQRKRLRAEALPTDAHLADLTRLINAQKALQTALDNAGDEDEAYDHALRSWEENRAKLVGVVDELAQRPEPTSSTLDENKLCGRERMALRDLYAIIEGLRLSGAVGDTQSLSLREAVTLVEVELGSRGEKQKEGLEVPIWIPAKYRIVDPTDPDYHSGHTSSEEELLLTDSKIPDTTSS